MAPERKRPTRSQLYQHLLVEKAFSHEMMETFSNDDSVYKKLNPFDYNEEILILEDQLKERFWKIINEHLTPRQLEIVKLLRDGATQQEAARKLGVNQSSITKSINGNVDYSKDNGKASYGGICKKLARVVDKDPTIKDIMQKISDLRNDTWI